MPVKRIKTETDYWQQRVDELEVMAINQAHCIEALTDCVHMLVGAANDPAMEDVVSSTLLQAGLGFSDEPAVDEILEPAGVN